MRLYSHSHAHYGQLHLKQGILFRRRVIVSIINAAKKKAQQALLLAKVVKMVLNYFGCTNREVLPIQADKYRLTISAGISL
ncbi:hypothetical protein FKM82_018051 [Ascaphus truei]